MKLVFPITAFILSLTLLSIGCHQRQARQIQDNTPFPDKEALLSGPEYTKLVAIQTKIYKEHRMNDVDLSLVESLLKAHPPVENSFNETERHRRILMMIGGKKTLTPMQADRLFNLASPFLTDKNEWVRSTAIPVVASTRSLRALPLLENMAKTDESAYVVKSASGYASKLRQSLTIGS